MLLLRIVTQLNKNKIPYAIVGGYAVALHGAVRGTLDIDLIIPHTEANFNGIEEALKEIGFESRLPVSGSEIFNFRNDYIEKRSLIAWSFSNTKSPWELVEVVLTEDLANCSVVDFKIQGNVVKVLSEKDLIRMKERSGRPQDLEDVRALRSIK